MLFCPDISCWEYFRKTKHQQGSQCSWRLWTRARGAGDGIMQEMRGLTSHSYAAFEEFFTDFLCLFLIFIYLATPGLICSTWDLQSSFQLVGSLAAECRYIYIYIAPHGIYFPDQGLNLCPLHWQSSLNDWTEREVPVCLLIARKGYIF